MKRAAKKKAARPSTALVAAPPPLPAFVRDDEMQPGRPDVIAGAMLGRVQELVAMAAYASADVARGTMTAPKLMQLTGSLNQLSMILAHQGMGLAAEARRLEDVRAEERNIVILANKSGDAHKLLRIILSTFGSEWSFHRMNDETGVMARIPMGKLIGDLLAQREVVPVNQGSEAVKVADEISEAEAQARRTVARVAAAGGTIAVPAEPRS